jgi:hypothetical protein
MMGRGVVRGPLAARLAAAAVAIPVAVAVAGCGSKDFQNDPRPPVPAEITARIDAKTVQVSPDKIGAGLANFTVANLSHSPERFQVSGETEGVTDEIDPGAVTYLKISLKEGAYRASAPGSGIKAQSIQVGPERKSSQNDLLLP